LNFHNHKKLKSLIKSLAVVFLSLALLIILFFSVLFTLFLIYKNDISKTILAGVNNKIEGEISFSEISFTPFRHFPNAALVLKDFSLKEGNDSVLISNRLPIININEAFISLDIVDLLSSKISISKITFEGGNINLIVYPDSQTNLQKAIRTTSEKKKVIQKKQTSESDTLKSKRKTTTKTPSDFSLNIDELSIDDLELNLENQFKKNKVLLKINELQSDFSYSKNQIFCSINLDTEIDSLIKNEKLLLYDQKINFESNLEMETDSIFVKLEEGRFAIGEAKFLFDGIYDSKNQGYVDLSFKASDEDFSLFSLFLSDESIKNLKSGDVYFEGTVSGKTLIEFPAIDISFGLNDVDLINPITRREIKNLNLKGSISSGKSDDWSDSKLKIDTLFADLQGGYLNLSGSLRNFKAPEVDLSVFLSADVTGLEKVFNLGSVTDLKGELKLKDRIKGSYNIEDKKFAASVNRGSIFLKDFGIRIPNTIRFDKVNGKIRRDNDELYLDSLSIISEDTDILLNGEINNLQYLFFNIEKVISANLTIKSAIFDLPNFLAFDPSIKRDFNYRILNVDADVIAKTTTSKATKFKSFPQLDFDIKKLNATIENFLPRIEINSGIYKISESILGFNMKFENFKTDFIDGKLNFSAEYNTSKHEPFYIKAKTDFKDIYLSKLFYSENDTVPESMKGKLSGSFLTDLQFPLDSTLLKFTRLKNADLVYELSKDTIVAKNLNVDFNKIYYNDDLNSNPFATLYTNGKLKADIIKSNSFNFKELNFDINVINGRYEFKSDVVRLFGENAKGNANITVSPFAKTPSYKIVYNDVSFRAEKMLSAFNEDKVIYGPLKLSFNISSTGSEWDSIVSNMNGTIKLSGDNLLLNGFDADEIINDFKRSQNFNFVDLGAVLLAGPVGIAVTKGSDFARILVFNSGKSTKINELVSNWTVSNGIFEIQDAAFITNTNRIALTGFIGFSNQNLDLTLALLDRNGCSIFSQQVYGSLDSPTLGKVKVVGTVLAPVTNLVDDVTGKDCVVFYSGSVKHPINKLKKK
jgi:AsmA protein